MRRPRLAGPFRAVLGPTRSATGQSLVALALNSTTSLVAGLGLAALTGTFARLPGLLILVPAAIGLRGNVFTALGNRLSTAIHTGSLRMTPRPGTVLGDNLMAALVLTALLSLALAPLATIVAAAFGIAALPILDLAAISVAGGMLASVGVLAATLALAWGGTRRGWDLDNLVAPLVSTLGDVLTIPALWMATGLVGHGSVSLVLEGAVVAGAGALVLTAWKSYGVVFRSVVRQSWPVLLAAAVLSTFAGVVIEGRLGALRAAPAVLILLPAFVSSAGALGGIFASRLSTALHLGTLTPGPWPPRPARRDAVTVAGLAVPVFLFNALGAQALASSTAQAGPGAVHLVAAALLGASGTLAFVLALGFYANVLAYRLRADPDSFGIPVITSSVDLVGAVALLAAVAAVGIAA